MKSSESIKSSQLNFWANFLLVLGILSFFLFCYLIYQRYNPQQLSFKLPEAQALDYVKNSNSSSQPIGIKVDSINLSLPVVPAEVKNSNWEVTSKGVSYLKTSAIPGEKGNSILYGHNWPNLLGDLKKVKPGDKLSIIYADNSSRNFEVEYSTKVSPSETSILQNSEDSRITLYTCTGFLDSQRLVVIAKLLNS